MAPENADVYSEFGDVERLRGENQHSEELYQRALKLNNDHRGALLGYAALMLKFSNKRGEARRLARNAWALGVPHRDCFTARAALLLAVIANSNNEDDQPALQRVKALLKAGYETPLRENSQHWLPPTYRENDLHRQIAKAMSDPYRVDELTLNDPRWDEIEPIGPDQPWPEEAAEVSE